MLDITRESVRYWAKMYDEEYEGSEKAKVEAETKEWIARQTEPKYLDRKNFLKVVVWKSHRPKTLYESNDESIVREATRLAYEASEPRLKLHILTVLKGVGVPVASTLLHFMYPDKYPIFDVRVRSSLKGLDEKKRPDNDASEEAWLKYVDIMREHSRELDVSLRDLDKALWKYDEEKGGKRGR